MKFQLKLYIQCEESISFASVEKLNVAHAKLTKGGMTI